MRKTKTDKKDARTIAQFILAHKDSVTQLAISQDLQDIRDMARERESLCHQISAVKVEIQRVLQTTFPELAAMTNPLTKVMLHFIRRFPSARLVSTAKPSAIEKTLKEKPCSCRLMFTPKELIEVARTSIATVSPAKELILSGKIETLLHLQKRRNELTKALTKYCESTIVDDLRVVTSIDGINNEEVFMPVYEYVCKDCNKEFIVFLSIEEFEAKPKIKYSHCKSDSVQRKITGFFTKTSKKS